MKNCVLCDNPAEQSSRFCSRDTSRLQKLYGTTACGQDDLDATPARWVARCALGRSRKPRIGWTAEPETERDAVVVRLTTRVERAETAERANEDRDRTLVRLVARVALLERETDGLRAWLSDNV